MSKVIAIFSILLLAGGGVGGGGHHMADIRILPISAYGCLKTLLSDELDSVSHKKAAFFGKSHLGSLKSL